MIVIGLTGSIGMGKTTTAGLFAECGVPVYDADAGVHALYAPGGAATKAVEAAFPGVSDAEGGIDRAALSTRVLGDPQALARLEAVVHPLLVAERAAFLDQARRADAAAALLDIPLLFETGAVSQVDVIVVVSAPPEAQRRRVLARPGMSPGKLEAILDRQGPDAEKRARAHYVVDTSQGIESARDQVRSILKQILQPA